MCLETDKARLEAFMAALGKGVRGEGRIYLAGGATAILHGWRRMTIDVDIKPDPEPAGLFEAIARLKSNGRSRACFRSPGKPERYAEAIA